MFKNRELRMQVVKKSNDPDAPDTTVNHWNIKPEEISKILTEQMRNVALVVGGFYVLKTALDTASEIAIIKSTPKS